MTIKLSICIPTYNRASYIPALLDSILEQNVFLDEIEVVVSDNASTDNTKCIIEGYFHKIPNLVYYTWPQNMGPDMNFVKSVELASGEYCWLFGSDDAFEVDSLDFILKTLENSPGLCGISVNHSAYNKDLTKKIAATEVAGGIYYKNIIFSGADETFRAVGDYLGYLSGQIICRSTWNRVIESGEYVKFFNAYVHVYIIGSMIGGNGKWMYCPNKLIKWRSGNDSFLESGVYKRMMIDVDGYSAISENLFGKRTRTDIALLTKIATTHIQFKILDFKLNGSSHNIVSRALYNCICAYWYVPNFWLKTFPLFLLPGFIFVFARWVYRKTLKQWKSNEAFID